MVPDRVTGEHLSAFVDAALGPEEEAVVRRHLEQDPRAARAAADFRQIKGMLRALPAPQAPPGLWDAIRANVDAQVHAVYATDARTQRRRLYGVIAAAAVIAILVLPAVMVAGTGPSQSTQARHAGVAGPIPTGSPPSGRDAASRELPDTPAHPDAPVPTSGPEELRDIKAPAESAPTYDSPEGDGLRTALGYGLVVVTTTTTTTILPLDDDPLAPEP